MHDFLVFQLYGPMAAWGDIAVGEYRPSFAHPSKSAIVGLLAAALGIRRDEDDRHIKLSNSFLFAVRVDSMGWLLRDYHTTQVPSTKRGAVHYTRKSELAGNDQNTILSSRDYRCDTAYTIAINMVEDAQHSVTELAAALQQPVFTLYLGRKSCPLALPVHPHIIRAASLHEALSGIENDALSDITAQNPVLLYWEDGLESGIAQNQTIVRRDALRSRKRWQFSERKENCGFFPKEDASCTSV
jgi:CRISPR system Cascade subunit CasD